MSKKFFIGILTLFPLIVFAAFDISFPKENEILQSYTTGKVQEELPMEFELLSWNIYKGYKDNFEIEYHLATLMKDIILFQESSFSPKVKKLYTEDSWSIVSAISFIHKNIPTGVSTLSNAKPISATYIKSSHREPIVKTPKMTLINIYDLKSSDKKLLVANIHGLNFVSDENQYQQFYNLVMNIKDHPGPIIIAGDFNTWNKKRQKSLHILMGSVGLLPVHFEEDTRKKFYGEKIDYIFYKGLTVLRSNVGGEFSSSDHKPLMARFRVLN